MAAGASTASPPILTPGSNTFDYQVFTSTLEDATYQASMAIPRFEERERPYAGLTINKKARLSSVALGAGAVGTGLTYQDPVASPATLNPAGIYVAIGWSANEDAETPYDFDAELGSEAVRALAEGNDQNGCANFSSLTEFRGNGGADVTSATLRNAQGLLMRNTNGEATPGKVEIYLILDHSQYNATMAIEEYANAEARGDDERPYVKGVWSKGGGHNLMFSGVLPTTGDGTHGCLWIRKGFAVAWNERSHVVKEPTELQVRHILFNHLGTTIQHNLRAVAIRTASTIGA